MPVLIELYNQPFPKKYIPVDKLANATDDYTFAQWLEEIRKLPIDNPAQLLYKVQQSINFALIVQNYLQFKDRIVWKNVPKTLNITTVTFAPALQSVVQGGIPLAPPPPPIKLQVPQSVVQGGIPLAPPPPPIKFKTSPPPVVAVDSSVEIKDKLLHLLREEFLVNLSGAINILADIAKLNKLVAQYKESEAIIAHVALVSQSEKLPTTVSICDVLLYLLDLLSELKITQQDFEYIYQECKTIIEQGTNILTQHELQQIFLRKNQQFLQHAIKTRIKNNVLDADNNILRHEVERIDREINTLQDSLCVFKDNQPALRALQNNIQRLLTREKCFRQINLQEVDKLYIMQIAMSCADHSIQKQVQDVITKIRTQRASSFRRQQAPNKTSNTYTKNMHNKNILASILVSNSSANAVCAKRSQLDKANICFFKSILRLPEYQAFLFNAQQYLLSKLTENDTLANILDKEQQAIIQGSCNICDNQFCHNFETIIRQLCIRQYLTIEQIENWLQPNGMVGSRKLFKLTEDPKEYQLYDILEQDTAYYKLDKAKISFDKQAALAAPGGGISKLLTSGQWITDFFTVEQMKHIINTIGLNINELEKHQDSDQINYNNSVNNRTIIDAMEQFISKNWDQHTKFGDIFTQDIDHRQYYPICILEGQGRIFIADEPPYKFLPLSDKSARQHSIHVEQTIAQQNQATPSIQTTHNIPSTATIVTPNAHVPLAPPENDKVCVMQKIIRVPQVKDASTNTERSFLATSRNSDFNDLISLLTTEAKQQPLSYATSTDAVDFTKNLLSNFFTDQQETIKQQQELYSNHIRAEHKVQLGHEFNKMELYHNLSIKQSEDDKFQKVSFMMKQSEDIDPVQCVDVICEKRHDRQQKVTSNMVYVNAVQAPPSDGELSDKECLIMLLSAKRIANTKSTVSITNCEYFPFSAIKLFLFAKVLDLTVMLDADTKKAIEKYTPAANTIAYLLKEYFVKENYLNKDSKTIAAELQKISSSLLVPKVTINV